MGGKCTICAAPIDILLCMSAQSMVYFTSVMSHVSPCGCCTSMLTSGAMMAKPSKHTCEISAAYMNSIRISNLSTMCPSVQFLISGQYFRLGLARWTGNGCSDALSVMMLHQFLWVMQQPRASRRNSTVGSQSLSPKLAVFSGPPTHKGTAMLVCSSSRS